MDAATIAAIAALVVAVIAFLVAFAQATQQYFITGQSIRLCDSVVYADMPGQGRRIWQMSQFRFRVVYSIPQISLPNDFWPRTWPVSHKPRKLPLPPVSETLNVPKRDRKWVEKILYADQKEPKKGSKKGRGDASVGEGHAEAVQPSNDLDVERNERSIRTTSDSASADGRPQQTLQNLTTWFSTKISSLPQLRRGRTINYDVLGPSTGEAAWVSFCRVIHYSCWGCVRYDLVERDVDRCPSDLPTVPMPLSMRDIVVMALNIGMDCTEASFPGRTLSMQGNAGILTTSQHPILGPLLHFTPGARVAHGIVDTGEIAIPWLHRLWDTCPVGGGYFTLPQRRNVEKTAGVWIHRIRSSAPIKNDLGRKASRRAWAKADESIGRKKVVVDDELNGTSPVVEPAKIPLSDRKGFHDGNWVLRKQQPRNSVPPPPAVYVHVKGLNSVETQQEQTQGHQARVSDACPSEQISFQETNFVSEKPYQAKVEDMKSAEDEIVDNQDLPTKPANKTHVGSNSYPNEETPRRNNVMKASTDPLENMRRETVRRQMERNAEAAKIADDEVTIKKAKESGKKAELETTPLLLEWQPKPTVPLTEEEEEALAREKERQKQRKLRNERDEERQTRNEENYRVPFAYGRVNWFWLSQTDILPGYWATPWRRFEALDPAVCSGAETIVINALSGFTDSNSLRYVNHWKGFEGPAMEWVTQGGSSFPGYALNARGGVVCSGDYPVVKVDVFEDLIPAIELYRSYEYQVKRNRRMDTKTCQKELLELMRLDAWLSLCGRTDEIQHGRNNLIKQTPAMVQLVLAEFEYDFLRLDQSDHEGGLQVNQALAANVMDFLLDEELSGAEQMYILIAILRTVKVGMCIIDGPDTGMLEGILREDIQVHMV